MSITYHTENPKTYQWAVDNPPIGIWQTNSGSATVLMSSVLTILPDGTGSYMQRSTSQEGEFSIIWRHRPGELQIYQGNEEHPVPVYENDWEIFRYRADWRQYGIGSGPILINDRLKPESVVYPKGGFRIFDSPIELIGRAE